MSLCKSCQAEVIWSTAVISGKPVILDKQPVPDGNCVIRNGKVHYLTVNNPVQPSELRYVSHFSTCEDAGSWRKKS